MEQLLREYLALPKLTAFLITPEERQSILRLAQNVPVVWHTPTTTQAERKQLLRYLNEVGSRRGTVCRSDLPGKDAPSR